MNTWGIIVTTMSLSQPPMLLVQLLHTLPSVSTYIHISISRAFAIMNNSYVLYMLSIGTHDILNATTTETDDDAIVITTLYSEHSDARGALFDFVFIDDNGDVDFARSVLLALDRNTSLHHTLPSNLYPGQYRVFVYDIESDGTLSNGVGYPAVTINLIVTCKDSQGKVSSVFS